VQVELAYVKADRDTGWIERSITVAGVDEEQRARLAEVAEKTPVTTVVRAGSEIRTIVSVV
jgi:putative redox protein